MSNGFFQDSEGNFSITRAVFAFMILNAVAMGWVTLIAEGHIAALTLLSGVSSVAIGLKLGQNVQENIIAKEKINGKGTTTKEILKD